MDFGCGGGIDVILAAHMVGEDGKVVGIDFAPQMIEQARQAVIESGFHKLTNYCNVVCLGRKSAVLTTAISVAAGLKRCQSNPKRNKRVHRIIIMEGMYNNAHLIFGLYCALLRNQIGKAFKRG